MHSHQPFTDYIDLPEDLSAETVIGLQDNKVLVYDHKKYKVERFFVYEAQNWRQFVFETQNSQLGLKEVDLAFKPKANQFQHVSSSILQSEDLLIQLSYSLISKDNIVQQTVVLNKAFEAGPVKSYAGFFGPRYGRNNIIDVSPSHVAYCSHDTISYSDTGVKKPPSVSFIPKQNISDFFTNKKIPNSFEFKMPNERPVISQTTCPTSNCIAVHADWAPWSNSSEVLLYTFDDSKSPAQPTFKHQSTLSIYPQITYMLKIAEGKMLLCSEHELDNSTKWKSVYNRPVNLNIFSINSPAITFTFPDTSIRSIYYGEIRKTDGILFLSTYEDNEKNRQILAVNMNLKIYYEVTRTSALDKFSLLSGNRIAYINRVSDSKQQLAIARIDDPIILLREMFILYLTLSVNISKYSFPREIISLIADYSEYDSSKIKSLIPSEHSGITVEKPEPEKKKCLIM